MAGEIRTIHPNGFQKRIHRFLMLKWVSDILASMLYRVDNILFSLTHGRFTLTRIVGLPIIELTTIGAKTGQERTMPLVSLPDGEKIALIASNFGGKQNPGWYYNLKANPECIVQYDGQQLRYLAREAFDAEREKYIQLAISYYEGYQKYTERAAPRRIPVMVLEPKR